MLVSLFFVVASFIEFGILLILVRAQILEGRQNTFLNKKADDIQENGGPKSAKLFGIRSRKHNVIALENIKAEVHKDNRYSVTDKIDCGSFICLMFLYILFNIVYLIQYAN